MKIKDNDKMILADGARELGVSPDTLRDWIENGYPMRVKRLTSERLGSNNFVSRKQVKALKAERDQRKVK